MVKADKIKDQKSKIKQESKVSAKKTASKAVQASENAKVTVEVKAETGVSKGSVQKGLSVEVFDLTGKVAGKVSLPVEIFGAKINKPLMAQAVKVYLLNQRQGTVSTKTRGEVAGSTRKIYRQKGTGRARHGGIRAPIFVKGGVAHGPKPKDYEATLSKNMKRAALFAALSAKYQDGVIKLVDGLTNIGQKTRVMAALLKGMEVDESSRLLLITSKDLPNISRAGRNLEGVRIVAADRLNTYEVLKSKDLVFMKEAIDTLQKTFLKHE